MLSSTKTPFMLIVIIWASVSLGSDNQYIAKVRPWDLNLHPGESLIVNCTVNDDNITDVNISSLYFWRYPSDGDPRVATTAHQVVGNNIMQIHLTNVNMSDAGFYRCYSGDDILIARTSCNVHIGEPTRPPENFTCVLYDFERMTCSWDHIQNGEVIYNLAWEVPGLAHQEFVSQNYFDTSYWELMSEDIHFKSLYNFTVLVGGRFGDNSAVFTIVADENIVQVGPVQDLHGDAISSTSISVTWGHVLLRNLSMWHKVNYTNEWDGVSEVLTLHYAPGDDPSILLNGLEPYTNYIITVHAFVSGSPYPPEPGSTNSRTLPAAPSQGPEIVSFRYDGCRSLRCSDVFVYWKDIPERHQRGLILSYEISVDGAPVPSVKATLNSANISLVSVSGTSIVSIRARDSFGTSPATNLELTDPKPVVSCYGEKNQTSPDILFSWNDIDAWWEELKLMSCYSPDGTANCHSDLTVYNLIRPPFLLENPPEDHVYGITASVDGVNGGLPHNWLCIHNYNGAIPKPSFDVLTSTDTSLTLHIEGQVCQLNEGKVLQYLIYYGEQECEKGFQHAIRKPANDLATEVILTDLPSGTKLNICVQAEGRSGVSEIASRTAITTKKDDDTGLIIIAVTVTVAIAVSIAVLVVIMLRYLDVQCVCCNTIHVAYPVGGSTKPNFNEFDMKDCIKETPYMYIKSQSSNKGASVSKRCYPAVNQEEHATPDEDAASDTDSGVCSGGLCQEDDVSHVMYTVIDCGTPVCQSCDTGSVHRGMALPCDMVLDRPYSDGRIRRRTSEETGFSPCGSTQSDGIYVSGNVPHSEAGTSCSSNYSDPYFDGYRVASGSVWSASST